MSNRIRRAVMIGFLISAALGASACLSPLGSPCGDGWCPDGFLCRRSEQVCVKSTCGNHFVEDAEECDDGNMNEDDGCLSTCKLDRCGDGIPLTEECDDGNNNNDDGCNNVCIGIPSVYIKAFDTGAADRFGGSVALSADGLTLATGAFLGDSGSQDAGAVYGYTRNGWAWSRLASVKASNIGVEDQFGFSVALSAQGGTLAVGAIQEDSAAIGIGGNQTDNTASNAGAVYVFTWQKRTIGSAATWRQQAYVKASNTGADDQFGYSVALSADGSTLAVSALGEDSAVTGIDSDQADNSSRDAGAVYVFTRSGTTWNQQAYVKASNTDSGDRFGESVALSADGSTLAVGASKEDSAATGIGDNQADNSAGDAGAVYVFTRSGTTWSQQAYVKPSNTGAADHFGSRVALSADGSTLAVGASKEDSAMTGINGAQTNNSALDAGAVYVFTRSGTTWSQQAYVKASNTDADDRFGESVALSADGSALAVGAVTEDSAATGMGGNQADNSAENSGAVYVFKRSDTTWNQQAYVKASNTAADDQFGESVALSADGSILAVGASSEDSAATGVGDNQHDNSANAAGAVYAYRLPGQQSLSTTAALSEPDAPAPAVSLPDGWLGP